MKMVPEAICGNFSFTVCTLSPKAMILQLWGAAAYMGRWSEIHDGPEIEWAAVAPQEVGAKPAILQHRTNVFSRGQINARHTDVPRLHSREMVYQDFHDFLQVDSTYVAPSGIEVVEHETPVTVLCRRLAA